MARRVNHDRMFIQMSKRVRSCTIRHALISLIGDETHAHGEHKVSAFHLLFNLFSEKHMMDVTLRAEDKEVRRKDED